MGSLWLFLVLAAGWRDEELVSEGFCVCVGNECEARVSRQNETESLILVFVNLTLLPREAASNALRQWLASPPLHCFQLPAARQRQPKCVLQCACLW